MHDQITAQMPNIAPTRDHFVKPQVFEPGLYVSGAPLPTEAQEAAVIKAYEEAPKPEQAVRAIGMAALSEEYQDQQLTNLTYNGMTSEEYTARHNAFLAEWTASEQRSRQALQSLQHESDDDDDDDEETSERKKTAGLVGALR